jgi:hypothetical protein
VGTCAPTEWGGYNFSLLGGSAGGFGLGGDGAFAPEAWVPSARRPYLVFSIHADSHHSRGLLQNGRGLPFLQRIFFVASCLGVSSWLTRISARRGRILSIPKIPSSASRRLCGRIWVGGRTARSRLKLGSPRRGDPTHFSIRVDSHHSRACSKTAGDCRCYNGFFSWLRAFV